MLSKILSSPFFFAVAVLSDAQVVVCNERGNASASYFDTYKKLYYNIYVEDKEEENKDILYYALLTQGECNPPLG